MKELLEEIKKKLRPESEAVEEANAFVEKVNALIKKSKVNAECAKGGSFAKGTFLRNDYDVDLFVRFDYSYRDKDISAMLEKILAPLNPEKVHGSRDYFQIKNKLVFEIVPVLRIEDYKTAVNVTDMSPLHVSWVKKHLDKNLLLKDEIRLSKQFCKAIGAYGAESYIQGFSGHVLDILILHYGSFEELLKAASRWGSKTIIDTEKHLKDPMKELNKSKTHSPLIVVDPLQPDRNAAAAVSREKYVLFIKKSKEFLKNPCRECFEIKRIDKKELKEQYAKEWLIFLDLEPLEGKKDIVGGKLLKIFTHIRKALKKHDFKLLNSGWEFGEKAVMYFAVKKQELSREVVRKGPPLAEKQDYERFMEKHKTAYVENRRAYAKLKRAYLLPQKLVKDILKKEYIKERAKNISMTSS